MGHQQQHGTATAPDRDAQQALRAKEGKPAGDIEDNSGTIAEVEDGPAGAEDLGSSDGEEDDDGPSVTGGADDGTTGDATAKPGRRARVKAKVRGQRAISIC